MLLYFTAAVLLLFVVLVFLWRSHRIPVNLIENWRRVFGLLSAKERALTTVLVTWLLDNANVPARAWEQVPESLRSHLPEWAQTVIAWAAIFMASAALFLAARLTKEQKS